MDQMTAYRKEKYLNVGFDIAKRLALAGYNMEMPAHIITWGQIAKELSRALVDHGIEPAEVTDETLIDLIEEVKVSLYKEDTLRWREIFHVRLANLDSGFIDSEEPDEGVFTEQFENATRLGDEEGYWIDGGASADFFDD
ncbi:MAG: hypothetical protein M1281_04185 [Chloroflexi bacterium]|nr:hypothetical protein [Chloroflexota bacterium]